MSTRFPDPGSELEEEGIPDLSDALPVKEITGDGQEEQAPPRDYPVAAEDFGTTAAEQRAGEPLDLRMQRELPDTPDGADPGGTPYPEDPDERVGRLVTEPESGTNKDQDMLGREVGTDGGAYAPEERAMHFEEPPG
jgi:hypothetical protein